MLHYVYRLTKINCNGVKKYYVGKRSGELDDLLTMKYKTSSKTVSQVFNTDEWLVKIVKIFNTPQEAIRFESKYHWRVDASRNQKFYNESNQSSDGDFDRTGLLTVIDNFTDTRLTITCDEYYSNRDRYTSISSLIVRAKELDTGKIIHVTKDVFYADDNLVGVNKGVMHVTEISTGNKMTITCDEYSKNKEKYKHTFSGISAYDTVLHKKCTVSKEDFDGVRYIGIKAFTKERKRDCPVCGLQISSSNIERHKLAHHNRVLWVTDLDNTNTYKCDEYSYYTKLKDNWNITPGNGYEGVGYINGVAKNLRYVGRVNKTIPSHYLEELK